MTTYTVYSESHENVTRDYNQTYGTFETYEEAMSELLRVASHDDTLLYDDDTQTVTKDGHDATCFEPGEYSLNAGDYTIYICVNN